MWRKALRICSENRVLKNALTAAILAIFNSFCFAQMVEMPKMPEVPSMPSISADGSFYRPSSPIAPSAPSAPAQTAEPSAQGDSKTADEKKNLTLAQSLDNQSLLDTLTGGTTLTAADISDLYDSGLFSTVSSLTGTSSAANLLERTLLQLNALKDSQQNVPPEQKVELRQIQADAQTFRQREPSILRFKINGYSITDSLTATFFSEPEADGSFLLTGDRRYYVNQVPLTETFYMLFKTVSSAGSAVSYNVQTSVVQDYKNENSFLYRLAGAENLTAEKTGNLVVMHFEQDDLKVEILLDIDKK